MAINTKSGGIIQNLQHENLSCCKFCTYTHPVNSKLTTCHAWQRIFTPAAAFPVLPEGPSQFSRLKPVLSLMYNIAEILFVFCLLGFFRPTHSYGAANFDLSVLMAIEQWRFFGVPHLLWRGASVYNGHLRDSLQTYRLIVRLCVSGR